jgi:hypothetical protein
MIKNLKILVSCFLLFATYSGTSQTIESKNTVYAEFLGKGFYYSINYERNLFQLSDKLSAQASAGFGLFPGFTDIEKSTDFTLPLELNLRYSMGTHNIVAGYGTTYWRYSLYDIPIESSNWDQQPIAPELKKTKEWFAHIVLEYRYQKVDGGLMFKAGWSPLFFAKMQHFAYQKKVNFANSFNFGIGYSF